MIIKALLVIVSYTSVVYYKPIPEIQVIPMDSIDSCQLAVHKLNSFTKIKEESAMKWHCIDLE